MTSGRRVHAPPELSHPARLRIGRASVVGCVVAGCLLVAAGHLSAGQRLQAEFTRVDAPAAVQATLIYSAQLEIRNTGSARWIASGAFRVSYHWLGPDGTIIVKDGRRTMLPRDVAPGEAVRLCAAVEAPDRPGPMTLQWDLVEEGVTWFSEVRPENAHSQAVFVRPPPPPPKWQTSRLALFFGATLAHFLLVVFWLRAFGSSRHCELDEVAFQSMVVGLGSFQAILDVVAFTSGLSLTRVLLALLVLHLCAAAAAVVIHRRSRLAGPPAMLPGSNVDHPGASRQAAVLSMIGAVIVAALIIQWAVAAPVSLRVTGADAAHYHVPYAVDIALGANPFGLPATPHLYPMGTSVLAAWFILPLGDPLLVDLTILLPFLLAWFAVVRLVREVSGQPGLGWGPWCALLLFSALLFRHSLLMSADLFYGAAFLAVTALLLKACVRLRLDRADLVSLGLALGMLVGTKVTGVFSAATLLAVYGLVIVARSLFERRRFLWSCLSAPRVALLILLGVASGGMWLIRGWWSFGSPLAPSGFSLFGVPLFEGGTYQSDMYYLSVLKDIRDVAHYNVMARLAYWIREWLGAWFLPAGLLVVVLIADVVSGLRRPGGPDEVTRTKVVFAGTTALLAAAHLLLLAGVPWSSLEWTRGFSLRYALPCFALYLLVACTSCLPSATSPWRRPRLLAVFGLVLLSIAWYGGHQGAPGVPVEESPGRLTPLGVGMALVLLPITVAIGRMRSSWVRGVAATVLVGSLATAYSAYVLRHDRALMRSAESDFGRLVSCGAGEDPGTSRYRRAYLSLLDFERTSGTACGRRRVFTTTRWDLPLELQSPRFVNEVFDVRGRSFRPALVRRDRPGTEPCDYVIASAAELNTIRGVPLVNALNAERRLQRLGEVGPYVVYGAVERGRGDVDAPRDMNRSRRP